METDDHISTLADACDILQAELRARRAASSRLGRMLVDVMLNAGQGAGVHPTDLPDLQHRADDLVHEAMRIRDALQAASATQAPLAAEMPLRLLYPISSPHASAA